MSKYGCLFCRSGTEERLIGELKNSHPGMECVSPKRVRVRRQGEKEIVPLFPGYILFKTEENPDFQMITRKADIYRLLKYPSGNWELFGDDLGLAVLAFSMYGVIDLSMARYEGDQVVMLDGPLKRHEKNITEINKRSKTAKIEIKFQERIITAWLGFEIV